MGQAFLELRNRGRTGWAFLVGLIVIFVCWQAVGSVLTGLALVVALGASGAPPTVDVAGAMLNPAAHGLDPFVGYVALNLSFVALLLGTIAAARWALRRPFLTLLTARPRLDWARVWRGFGIWLVLMVLISVAEALLYPGRYQFTFNPLRFFPLLPIVLILTPIQTTTEEILFRGYLLQWLAGLTRHPLVLSVVSGVLFMLPHFGNPEAAVNLALAAPGWFVPGFVLALATLKTNGLEYALGVHAANNLFAALIANHLTTPLATDSILTVGVFDPVFSLISTIVAYVIFYVVLLRMEPTTVLRDA